MSLRGRLLLALAYVLVLAIVALEVPLALSLRDRVDAEVRSQARSQADVVAALVSGRVDEEAVLRDIVAASARPVRGRVVVVGADGALLADSAGEERIGIAYGDRPEIADALRGTPVQEQRRSETLDQEILATAVPVLEGGRPAGAVRVTQSVEAVARATRRAILGLAAIGLLVLGLGLAAGLVIARQIAGPLHRSTRPRAASARATSPRAPASRAAPSSSASRAPSTT